MNSPPKYHLALFPSMTMTISNNHISYLYSFQNANALFLHRCVCLFSPLFTTALLIDEWLFDDAYSHETGNCTSIKVALPLKTVEWHRKRKSWLFLFCSIFYRIFVAFFFSNFLFLISNTNIAHFCKLLAVDSTSR